MTNTPRIRAGVFGKLCGDVWQADGYKKGHPRRGAVRRRAMRSPDDLMRAHLEAKGLSFVKRPGIGLGRRGAELLLCCPLAWVGSLGRGEEVRVVADAQDEGRAAARADDDDRRG